MRVRKCRRETASDFAALVRDDFLLCGLSLHRVWFVHRALVGGGWWRLGLHRGGCASLVVPTDEVFNTWMSESQRVNRAPQVTENA